MPHGGAEGARSATAARRVADPHGSFHGRLNHIFATVRLPDREYTAAEVAGWVAAHGGRLSAIYILKLRSGEKARPSTAVLDWLARFFQVPAEVFDAPDPPKLDGPVLSAAVAVRDDDLLRAIVQQFLRLTPRTRAAVVPIICNALAMERRGTQAPAPRTEPFDLDDRITPEDAIRHERVREVLTLLLQLSPTTRAAVAEVIDSVAVAEGRK